MLVSVYPGKPEHGKDYELTIPVTVKLTNIYGKDVEKVYERWTGMGLSITGAPFHQAPLKNLFPEKKLYPKLITQTDAKLLLGFDGGSSYSDLWSPLTFQQLCKDHAAIPILCNKGFAKVSHIIPLEDNTIQHPITMTAQQDTFIIPLCDKSDMQVTKTIHLGVITNSFIKTHDDPYAEDYYTKSCSY